MLRAPIFAAALALIAVADVAPAEAQSLRQQIGAGRAIAQENCAACHSIGTTGASKRKGAPPLRSIQKRYELEALQEALAEGIAVGHKGVDMPEFQFRPDQIDALIAYIRSITK